MNNDQIDKLDSLRQNYFILCLNAKSKDGLLDLLPSPYLQNFNSLMYGIINLLRNEIESYKELYEFKSTDELEKEVPVIFETKTERRKKRKLAQGKPVTLTSLTQKQNFEASMQGLREEKKEFDLLVQKLQLIKDYFEVCTQEQEKFDVDPTKKINVVFAVNEDGNNIVLKDVKKNIPKEYYDRFITIITKIHNGEFCYNQEKFRALTNDKNMQGLFEGKEHKPRVIFRRLPNNFIYIIMARMKKDDKSLIDKIEPIQRSANVLRQYKQLEERIKNKINLAELAEFGEEQYEEIIDYLTVNFRGKKEKKHE